MKFCLIHTVTVCVRLQRWSRRDHVSVSGPSASRSALLTDFSELPPETLKHKYRCRVVGGHELHNRSDSAASQALCAPL